MKSTKLRMPVLAPALLALSCTTLAPSAGGAGASGPVPKVSAGPVEVYSGMCDASAAVAPESGLFVVANDEDNELRLFRAGRRQPLQGFDLTPFLGPERRHPETDIEAVAALGERQYWITSHARSRKGRLRESRFRFFATTIDGQGDAAVVVPVGRPYSSLLADLLADERTAPFELRAAAAKPPKDRGGLNIEGLAATADGALLIAFRNPVPEGRALLVPLLNPDRVVAEEEAERAVFGDPVLLELAGRGVRAIEWIADRQLFLIVGGPAGDSGAASALFSWSGDPAERPAPLAGLDLADLNPEALASDPAGDRVRVLSDDGSRSVGGRPCKSLESASARSFRAIELRLD